MPDVSVGVRPAGRGSEAARTRGSRSHRIAIRAEQDVPAPRIAGDPAYIAGQVNEGRLVLVGLMATRATAILRGSIALERAPIGELMGQNI